MGMSEGEFQALVARLEGEWQEDPSGYQRRVVVLGMVGYLYVAAILLLLLGLLWGMVVAMASHHGLLLLFKKLALPILVLVWLVGRALWVRLEEPQGIELTAADYPKLFKTLASIRKKLQGPPLHKVLLTDDFNASIVQLPLLGLFGWHRNYLLIGMPLMSALSPKEFLAVLAHEYGHLSAAHGKGSAWVYRIRTTWYRLMEALDREQQWGSRLFARFFDWYAPYFNAYSYVMARANEYQADLSAAQVAGEEAAGSALVRVTLAGSYLDERFWPTLYRQACERPTPLATPYHDMRLLLRKDITAQQAQQWLDKRLTLKTDPWDTHPALADRLSALGQRATLPGALGEDAAHYFLQEHLEARLQQLAAQWQGTVKEYWEERHASAQERRKRLAELEGRLAEGVPLSADEAFDQAHIIEELHDGEAALPLYRQLVERAPDHPHARYSLGRLLLEQEDAEGVAHLEQAMAQEEAYVGHGCQLLYGYYRGRGEEEQAEQCVERYRQWQEREAVRQREREELSPSDHFISHGLDSQALVPITGQLQGYPEIARAWLGRKALKHSSEPLYLLTVECRFGKCFTEKKRLALQQRLAEEMSLPGEAFIVVLGGENRRFAKPAKRISNGQIYG